MLDFSDICHQQSAIDRIQQSLRSGRLPHAMLFAGPSGVGKRTTALALGRTLLCQSPGTFQRADLASASRGERKGALLQACGGCESCRLVAAQTHPDLHVIHKELVRYHPDKVVQGRKMQDLGIDVIRHFLIGPAWKCSAMKRGKVFVVLDADLMSDEAQNALLKTLEEPPPLVRIILITQQAEALLATTLSRCWLVRFSPLPRSFVSDRLIGQGVPPQEAHFWAGYTDGSLGQASRLHESGLYEVKRELADSLANLPACGRVELAEELRNLADKLSDQAVGRAKREFSVELAESVAGRHASAMLIQLIASLYRDAMLTAAGSSGPICNSDQPRQVNALAGRFAPRELVKIINQLAAYETMLWRNVNQRLLWDNIAITCASAAPLAW